MLDEAPRLSDHLCPDCREHFDAVLALVRAAGLEPDLDFRLVRGLDYYTRTTFEFNSDRLGAQSGVGGGGRYDGLVEQIGGPADAGGGLGQRPRAHRPGDARAARGPPAPDVYVVELQRRRPPRRPSPWRRSCAGPAWTPSWISPGAAPRGSSSRPAGAAPRFAVLLGLDGLADGVVRLRTMDGGGEEDVAAADLTAIVAARLAGVLSQRAGSAAHRSLKGEA